MTSKGHGTDAWKDDPEKVPVEDTFQSEKDATVAFSEDDDFFGILGISPNASVAEIRSAFRRQARHYHPDKNDGDSKVTALKNFHCIQAAYEVLIDDTKRSLYKTYGHQTFAKIFDDPLLRQHHTSVICNIINNVLKPFEYTNALFKDSQQADKVLQVLTRKPVVMGYAAAVCTGTILLLALLSGFLTLTLGVSLISGFGVVVLAVLPILSGVAFTLLWCLVVHGCIVHMLVQNILSVIERLQAQHGTR